MSSQFKGKVILITGATSGIGHAAALHFADLGCNVVAASRSADAGADLVKTLESLGTKAGFVQTDVTDSAQVKSMVDYAVSEFGHLDFAFNNAGIFVPEPELHEHGDALWHEIISTNLTSVYTCMRYECAAMLHTKGADCVIVNNASIIGHRGSPASGIAYTTAKHGVIGLTRQAALDYVNRGIRVNAVSPGPTLTAATRSGLEGPQDEVNARLSTLNPTGKLVAAEDIASMVAYLCSPAASMINGHDIPLDGGQLARL
jgi:NAD(P)-dependent dehydrogenase (short-subunit alcohol dehydrogenase family)